MQNRQNSDDDITKKDAASATGAIMVAGGVTVAVVVGIGGLVANGAGVGATIGGVMGGPIGIGVGAVVGALAGALIWLYEKNKSRARERAMYDLGMERDNAVIERDRLRVENTKNLRIIELLEHQNKILQLQITEMQRMLKSQSEMLKSQSDRMSQIEDILYKNNLLSVRPQPQPQVKTQEEEINLQNLLKAVSELRECLEDSVSLASMEDPVIADDGNLYDRPLLQLHYNTRINKDEAPKCPKTPDQKLSNPATLPSSSHAIKALEFLKKNFSGMPELQTAIHQEQKCIEKNPELKNIFQPHNVSTPSISLVSSSTTTSSSSSIISNQNPKYDSDRKSSDIPSQTNINRSPKTSSASFFKNKPTISTSIVIPPIVDLSSSSEVSTGASSIRNTPIQIKPASHHGS